MNIENINNNGIKWGPFRLRIPFIHIKLLPSEFAQGLIISGATALAGAPVVEALGLTFMQAVAVCFIASFLIALFMESNDACKIFKFKISSTVAIPIAL